MLSARHLADMWRSSAGLAGYGRSLVADFALVVSTWKGRRRGLRKLLLDKEEHHQGKADIRTMLLNALFVVVEDRIISHLSGDCNEHDLSFHLHSSLLPLPLITFPCRVVIFDSSRGCSVPAIPRRSTSESEQNKS